ncbi:hypothetical protein CFK37_16675 [Virgibacillus phasianinus]|uniref:DUF1657 domain-containing protein n=1 Tax=Virgibacillus phasianinus TaxID=2017483 RepID=A0A220U6Z6_9BACI|nr:DUF1657 domain-containing protein [Virgibacillus phasianinus]ASK63676.1 hypothetical protein CFK37_16675 [Virgibacillus phasianinus]
MTIGSQVKSCFSSLKSAEATLSILASKAQDQNTKQVYEETKMIIDEVKKDLQKQVIYLTKEEPQYKS